MYVCVCVARGFGQLAVCTHCDQREKFFFSPGPKPSRGHRDPTRRRPAWVSAEGNRSTEKKILLTEVCRPTLRRPATPQAHRGRRTHTTTRKLSGSSRAPPANCRFRPHNSAAQKHFLEKFQMAPKARKATFVSGKKLASTVFSDSVRLAFQCASCAHGGSAYECSSIGCFFCSQKCACGS